ncbi:Mbov_0397 family ICE element conjugal transfer ATPase [Metamycoplasma equirhinis]|uniref:Mbov_0397 family ICE element conjugal transfer ATPase n=3 Tax=Metamycoplasma equirhinis TaxID=92402 RepID=UPI003593334D
MIQNKRLSKVRLALIKNFTAIDILWIIAFTTLSATLAFLTTKAAIWIRFAIFCVLETLFASTLFNIPSLNSRVYFLIFKIFAFYADKRQYNTAETQKLCAYETLVNQKYILNKSGYYFSVLKINGFNVFNLKQGDKEAYFNKIIDVFDEVNFPISFVKYSLPTEITKNIKYIENLKKNNISQISQKIKNKYFNALDNDFLNLKYIDTNDEYYLVIKSYTYDQIESNSKMLYEKLAQTKFDPYFLKNIELIKFINHSFFNKKIDEIELEKYIKSVENINSKEFKQSKSKLVDLIKPNNVKFRKKHIEYNNNKFMSFQVSKEFKSFSIAEGWTTFLTQTQSNFIWNLIPLNEVQKEEIIDKTSGILEANQNSKSKFRQFKTQAEIDAIDNLVINISQKNANVFNSTIILQNIANDLQTLKEIEKDNKNNAISANIRLLDCQYDQKLAFYDAQFTSTSKLDLALEMPSQNIIKGYPWISSSFNDGNSFLIGTNMTNQSPIIFQLSKRNNTRINGNACILGTSGAGKSVLTKSIAISELMENNTVTIIDPQDEYREFVNQFSGSWINLGSASGTVLNPLQLSIENIREDTKDKQKIAKSIINANLIKLSDFFAIILGQEFNAKYSRFMQKTMSEFYDKLGFLNKNIYTLKSKDFPILTDYINFLKEYKFTDQRNKLSYETILSEFIVALEAEFGENGKFNEFYNGHTNFDLNANLCVINTKDINSYIQNPITVAAMFLILKMLQTKINVNFSENRDKQTFHTLIIDEAHKFINAENMQAFLTIFDIIKTGRKFRNNTIITTQNIADFFQSPTIANRSLALFSNIPNKFFLKSSSDDIEKLSQILTDNYSLIDTEASFLLEAPRGTGLMILSAKERMPFKVHLNDFTRRFILGK